MAVKTERERVLWHCWLGDRKGIGPVKSWVLVFWWWWFDWSFAQLIAPIVTTISIILCFNKHWLTLTWVHLENGRLNGKREKETSDFIYPESPSTCKLFNCITIKLLLWSAFIVPRSKVKGQSSGWLFKSQFARGRGILWWPYYRPRSLFCQCTFFYSRKLHVMPKKFLKWKPLIVSELLLGLWKNLVR